MKVEEVQAALMEDRRWNDASEMEVLLPGRAKPLRVVGVAVIVNNFGDLISDKADNQVRLITEPLDEDERLIRRI